LDEGEATIAAGNAYVDVTLRGTFDSSTYGVGVVSDGNEIVWISNKTSSGFRLNRAGTTGDRVVSWVAADA